jgi:Fe-S-cluster containining protein
VVSRSAGGQALERGSGSGSAHEERPLQDPWYRAGLRFRCQRCGYCCTGDAGTVLVADGEIEGLAEHLGLAPEVFRKIYTRSLRRGDVSLREKSTGECIFFDDCRGCTVYAQRPRQCRTWPFWRAVVHSPERWDEEAGHCPGMNRGPLWSADRIGRLCAEDGTSGSSPGGAGPGRESCG